MLGTRDVPQAYVDDRAIRASDREKILGLKATNTIPVAQTIIWPDVVAMTDDQRDLSSLVQPGNRAMPIRVAIDDELTLIRPGDFVDVIGVMNDTKETSVLLQRVLVLASGTRTSNDHSTEKRERVTTLTLSVSLQEGQLLALAMEKTRLTVAIRNPDDQRIAETPPDLSATALGDAQRRLLPSSRRRGPQGPVRLEVEQQPR